MKKIVFIVVFTAFCGKEVSAQDYFRIPSVKVGNTVLMCEKLTNRFQVRDASFDTTRYEIVEPQNVSISNVKFISQRVIHFVFFEVFTLERLKELSENEKIFDMVFYVNNKGLLYQTSYTVAFNSKLKPSELVKLDSLMKQRFKFTTDEFEKTGNEKLQFSQLIRYEKIINGEKIRPLDEWEYP